MEISVLRYFPFLACIGTELLMHFYFSSKDDTYSHKPQVESVEVEQQTLMLPLSIHYTKVFTRLNNNKIT